MYCKCVLLWHVSAKPEVEPWSFAVCAELSYWGDSVQNDVWRKQNLEAEGFVSVSFSEFIVSTDPGLVFAAKGKSGTLCYAQDADNLGLSIWQTVRTSAACQLCLGDSRYADRR
jgi:hypothetical protein